MQQVINIIRWQGSYTRGKMEFKPSTSDKLFTFLPVMTPEGFETCCYDIYNAKFNKAEGNTNTACAEMRNEAT